MPIEQNGVDETMGNYMNPQKAAEYPSIIGQSYAELARQVNANEVVVAIGDRGVFKLAPLMDSQREYDEFYGQYRMGELLSLSFKRVPRQDFVAYQIS